MISTGEAIFFIEYLDHGLIYDLKELEANPLTLWVVGKIFKETDDYLAIVCSGTKHRLPNSKPSFEVVVKTAIIKKEVIHIVE